MWKATAVVLAALTTVLLLAALLLAAPAAALREPFDPVITSDTDTTDTTTTDTTGSVDEPDVTGDENPFSEGVPTTGADTSSWLVLAYVLVVSGGAAVVLARVLRPAPLARR